MATTQYCGQQSKKSMIKVCSCTVTYVVLCGTPASGCRNGGCEPALPSRPGPRNSSYTFLYNCDLPPNNI